MSICPICQNSLELPSGATLNELISCPECASELEIIGLNPPELVRAPEIEEDWGE